MARSPSHKFGQIIGELLERMLYAPLKTFADKPTAIGFLTGLL